MKVMLRFRDGMRFPMHFPDTYMLAYAIDRHNTNCHFYKCGMTYNDVLISFEVIL